MSIPSQPGSTMRPLFRPLLACLVAGAVLAPTAQASPDQVSIMMDDDLLVYRDDNTRFRAMQQMKNLGTDTLRVTVLWKVVAENAKLSAAEIRRLDSASQRSAARRQAKRFRAGDPSTYPTRNWDRYDNLVKDARTLGLQVYFNVTGPGPSFAHAKAPRNQRANQATWKPKAGAFKQYVTAVGKRYSGTFRDENGDRQALPRVSFWSLWNEPNQAGWLSPQWERKGANRTLVPASPALFRELHHFGHQGLVASGHGGDVILLAETAPLGSSKRTARSPMRPKQFLRELACVRSTGQRYTGGSARLRDCGDFSRRGALKATGYGHHPYTKKLAPTRRGSHPNSITMANVDELGTLLDNLSARTGGAIPRGLPLFMTEFGYETAPPDPFSGVSLDDQARFNQLGEFIAYSKPRIAGIAQFLLRDVGPVRKHRRGTKPYWFTYQSGLFFNGGEPKPAARAYVLPLVAFNQGTNPSTGAPRVGFWGQLRFRPNGAQDVANIEHRANPGAGWTAVGQAPANQRGFFTATYDAPAPGGEYRATYVDPATGALQHFSLGTTP